jgi:Ni/Co efflux regulator RcnB
MKKFLLMIVITLMAFTAAFAQHDDRSNQDKQRRDGHGYSSHRSRHYHHSRHRSHRDNGDHRN